MEVESKIELKYIVQSKDLAKELSIDEQDDFPEVFATSRMIALMELAAARLMKSLLADEELSVGVNVNVNHFAATPVDEEIRVDAIYKGMEGKLYKFEVEMYDEGGKAGSGTHTRAIVKTERLVQGALNRVKT
ncbi:MAG: thioesterase [Gammaproteobacteria bacterium]|nr:MAG: thioesterase [Gammaproteobacteria bacterium]